MIALISDIHGNFSALSCVLERLDSLGVSEIYCLGDIAGYYSQINECCNALKSRNIPCVMGNHDWYMIGGGFCPRSKSVNDCLAYQRSVITEENIAWLSTFPAHREVNGLKLAHGGWTDPIDEYLVPSAEYFLRVEGCGFASGHTHIQYLNRYGGTVYCNPGSVGQPRDGDNRAAFALWDGKEFMLERVSYNIDEVGRLMDQAGLSGYYYGCLRTGAKSLGYAKGEES